MLMTPPAPQHRGTVDAAQFVRLLTLSERRVYAFILSLVFSWNEYFFAVILSGADAPTLPVILAGQTSSQGTRWWTIGALATAAITPLLIIGLLMEKYIVMGLTAGAVK